MLSVKGDRDRRASSTANWARLLWDNVGMSRNEAGLAAGARHGSPSCARSSGSNVSVPGEPTTSTRTSSTPARVADYLEFAELLALDALERRESCGGHFREESQTPDGEAMRDDEHFCVRGRVGVHGRRQAAGPAQGAARRSRT